MLDYNKFFNLDSFGYNQNLKSVLYLNFQKSLSKYHYKNCSEYKKISNNLFSGLNTNSLDKILFTYFFV